MNTILIQLINQKAIGLIHYLEELRLIKVLKENVQTKQKVTEKYASELPSEVVTKKKPSDFFGTLNQEDGEKMQAYITQSRNEWERNI